MKKNIVIAVLVLTNLLSLMYGFVQKAEADKQQAIAVEQRNLAERHQRDTERHLEELRQVVVILEEAQKAKDEH